MADPSNLPPLPKDHLDHPEQWATGAEPATGKQKGFIKVLEGQHPDAVPEKGLDVESMGKSEASEVIEKLKNGKKVGGDDENTQSKADVIAEAKEQDAPKPAESDTKDSSNDDSAKETSTPESLKRKTAASSSKATDAAAGASSKKGDASQTVEKDDSSSSKRTTRSRAKSATKKETAVDAKKEADASDAKDDKEDDGHVEKKPKRDSEAAADDEKAKHAEDAEMKSSETVGKDDAAPQSPVGEELVTPHTGSPSAEKKENVTPAAASKEPETVPGDGEHLDHPENWTTGDEPATEKQKGFLAVLEKKKGMEVENMNSLGKSEASEKIDELK